MSGSVASLDPLAASEHSTHTHTRVPTTRGERLGTLALFVLVVGAELTFGMWMNSRGFIYNDALSRTAGALLVLYGADPHLAALGFVWMPLPSLLELPLVAIYPLWPAAISSGYASTLITALAGGASAVLVLETGRRLGISPRLGWAYALLIAANPMLFLYASNGLSEGVAAPCLIGATCLLVLFWHSGRCRYVALAGLALALGAASLYQAVPYGAGLVVALVLGALYGSGRPRDDDTWPLSKRWRFAEGLGILLVAPSFYVEAAWVGANGLIMKDPLHFATSPYSNSSQTRAIGGGGPAAHAAGDLPGTLGYVGARALPFLIPGVFVIAARTLDGRLWRVNTLSLVLLLVSVPLGLIAPLLYLGASFGWLRFFMYPLFVAAGWGLYEIAQSRRRDIAARLVLAGWIVAVPFILVTLASPTLGQEEHLEVQALLTGETASQAGFDGWIGELAPVAKYLEGAEFSNARRVALDPYQGSAIAAQMKPEALQHLYILPPGPRLERVLQHPSEYYISYLLVPSPAKAPRDTIVQAYPRLWAGHEVGFALVASFPDIPQEWRLYRIETPSQVPGRGHGESLLTADTNVAATSPGTSGTERGYRRPCRTTLDGTRPEVSHLAMSVSPGAMAIVLLHAS
jgi:hypothetical protein